MVYENREEIDVKYTWDLSSMCESDEAFEKRLAELKNRSAEVAAYNGKISKSAADLLGYLKLCDEVEVELSRLYNYARCRCDQDTRVSRYQNYSSQAMTVYVEFEGAMSWFTPELLTIDDETLAKFYAEQPELETYRRRLNMELAMREHTLSQKEEQLLAAAGEMATQPDQIFTMFNDADLIFPDAVDSKGEKHKVTHGNYVTFLMSNDRVLRESAFHAVYSVYRQFRDTTAALLQSQTTQLKFFAQARHYASSLEASMFPAEVPVSVYHNLIEAVHQDMEPMYRYVKLRKRLLGVEELHFYDVYAPIVGDVEMNFTYEEACELIKKALAPMGEDYLAIVEKGLSERWVDVYENTGKRSGAYSSGGAGMNPVILMSFQGTLDDVYTLIHEMGHSVHTYLSAHNQPVCTANYAMFVAEVASTCNEALLTQYLLAHIEDPKQKAYILNHYLEQFKGTLYRQAMFAEFELRMNEMTERGEGLTADALMEMYGEIVAGYFGPDMVLDDDIRLEWARIPHLYLNFYVYQYAIGYAAAIALSQRILTGGEAAVKDYLGFISGGCSKTPLDLLRGAGVDMESPEPIHEALKIFAGLVDELDSIM